MALTGQPALWRALAAARAHDAATRVPFYWVDPDRSAPGIEVGAIARVHVKALSRWPQWLRINAQRVTLTAAASVASAALAEVNNVLRADGLIVAWRDESFALYSTDGQDLGLRLERAATRFWGSLTLGAHCNGYVADAAGRPQRLWIARRALNKATDPGRLDNLIGAGVPLGQSPREAVLREGWEEAGLKPEQMHALAPGRIVQLLRDIPEGLQREAVHVFDLALPDGVLPNNQDGEVAEFELHDMHAALALASGEQMTVDAALVTLEFALRHRLLPDDQHSALAAASAELFVYGTG